MLKRIFYFLVVMLIATASNADVIIIKKAEKEITTDGQSLEQVPVKKVKSHAKAQTDDPCSSGGAIGLGICERDKLKNLEIKMAQELSALLGAVKKSSDYNKKTIKIINNAQQVWLKYRDQECEIQYSLRTAASTWNATYFALCQVLLTEERIQMLITHKECVSSLGQGCYPKKESGGS